MNKWAKLGGALAAIVAGRSLWRWLHQSGPKPTRVDLMKLRELEERSKRRKELENPLVSPNRETVVIDGPFEPTRTGGWARTISLSEERQRLDEQLRRRGQESRQKKPSSES